MSAYLRLARPGDNLFAAVGTVIGAGLANTPHTLAIVLTIALSNALLSAASMAFNDWHDVAEDAVNRPDRPIPSGAIQRPAALRVSLVLFSGGMLAAAAGGWVLGLAAAGVTAVSVLYTWRLKSMPLVGNMAVGLLSSYPLWCWAIAGGVVRPVYAGAAAAFFIGGAGREIVRTAADAAGDGALGIRTVATTYGAAAANRLGLFLIFAGLLCAWSTAIPAGGLGYATALGVTTIAMSVVGAASWRAGSETYASRRITWLARTMTVLLAIGVLRDLLASGWLQR